MSGNTIFDQLYQKHIDVSLLPPTEIDRHDGLSRKIIRDIIIQAKVEDILQFAGGDLAYHIERITVQGYGEVNRYGSMTGAKSGFRLYRNLGLLGLPLGDRILGMVSSVKISEPELVEDFSRSLMDDIVAHDDRNDWRSYLPSADICMGGRHWPSGLAAAYSLFHYHQQGQRHQWESPKFRQKEFLYMFWKA